MKHLFLSLLIITLAIFVFSPFITQADDFCKSGIVPCGRNCDNPDTLIDETKPCTLCHLIVGFWNVIDYAMRILTFVAFTALVIAGIIYIVSAGNEEMIKTAKNFIKNILFGFGIVLLAWVLIFTAMNYFGVKSNLGIEEADGWNKFTCDTTSTVGEKWADTGSKGVKYSCDKVDVNNNGTIDEGETACNQDPSGILTYEHCVDVCKIAPTSKCGLNDEGYCIEGLFCPATTSKIDSAGKCGFNHVCCQMDVIDDDPINKPWCELKFDPTTIKEGDSTYAKWTSRNDADGQLEYSCTGSGNDVLPTTSGSKKLENPPVGTCTLTVVSESNETATCLATLVVTTGPVCPNGIKEGDEECDDGNEINGDGCSATCQNETVIPPADSILISDPYPYTLDQSISPGAVKKYHFQLKSDISQVVIVQLSSRDWKTNQDLVISKNGYTNEVICDRNEGYYCGTFPSNNDYVAIPTTGKTGDTYYITVFNMEDSLSGKYLIYWKAY